MPRDALLDKVLAYAAEHGIADKSLREIATGVGTSHRMLLYHFGSREGLLSALVGTIEEQQRAVLTALATGPDEDGAAVMLRLWEQVSQPGLRSFVRLFFATVGLAVQGVPGTEGFLENLTAPWLDRGGEAQERLGFAVDPVALRLGVAVSRGLLLELVAGAEPVDVDASYRLFVQMWQRFATV
jgi:AcrR family transcriptional regulator